jgi:8-oxo-dGTP diphosphatase
MGGAVDRDPRMRIISVAYFALVPAARFEAALKDSDDLALAALALPSQNTADRRADGPAEALSADGETLALAFDHAEILGHALRRLRGKLDYSRVAFALLPELFTLRALQEVHEAIRGERLNKPAFRRRMLDRGWLVPTGERETGASFRPAELYRFKDPDQGE